MAARFGANKAAGRARGAVQCRAASWLPGSTRPAYLDGSAPGDYGFDPLELGAVPETLQRMKECELIHARWCMLAAAGIILPEALGFGNWLEAPLWAVSGGSAKYFGVDVPFSVAQLAGLEFVMMAGSEALRNEETDPVKRCYPGGPFDPLGFSKDPSKLRELQVKEIANGRLAMLAVLGFFCQANATGAGPVANWAAHVADPWHVNVATNGVSIPFLS
eukprot:CAMPEP_0119128386 /NCGR_PEP_ID=MMETSP1310-20130426/6563_1 /TAXON_ID=464262 /ORGANISM="Genus nov. species nov., Strain RCC2339" /LENGTH=218 /DNA_ID=CAMNT_0007118723 /DNA_START=21 /DNA_END=677 /DNA_ORIENTATION=+